jgi:mRNA deadenylase 3'-5' endonuclease subunit Ccr4
MNLNNKNISDIYDRDNVCLFAVLKYKADPSLCLIVASTHILFNNRRGDVKLGQVYQIINTFEVLKNYYQSFFQKGNLILCGDFNSAPNSGVYKMITTGSLDCSKLDKRKV